MLEPTDIREDQRAAIDWLKYRTEAMLILPVGFGKTIVTLTAIKEILDVLSTYGNPDIGTPERTVADAVERAVSDVFTGVPGSLRGDIREGDVPREAVERTNGYRQRRGEVQYGGFGHRERVLVVSTKNIIEHTWPDEIASWSHVQGFSYASAVGRDKASVLAKPDILGVNFENLCWFYDLCDADPSLLPEILVIDESSKMSAADSKRVARHCGFRRKGGTKETGYVYKFKRRFALSATPNAEGYAKLWAQEACVSSRRRLGENITMFRNRYCSAWANDSTTVYTVFPEAEKMIETALSPITYVAPNMKYLDLPDPIDNEVRIPWTDEGWAQYETLRDEASLVLQEEAKNAGIDLSGFEGLESISEELLERMGHLIVSAPNVGVLFNKLRQVCSGFVYDQDRNATTLVDGAGKIDALHALRERSAGAPTVVFTQFVETANQLSDEFRCHVGLPKSLDAWNAGHAGFDLLVLHPRSAGHGINLQRGSHNICWYELPWSYDEYHQGIGRLQRTGQRHQVSNTRFVRENSIELMVWKKIQTKAAGMSRFIENVR